MLGANCLDISNWTGPITPQQAECWKADGIELVIVGLQYPSQPNNGGFPPGVAHLQIPVLLGAGIQVQVYVYLYAGANAAATVNYSLDKVASLIPVGTLVWVDVEDNGLTSQDVWDAITVVRALGYREGIYTGKWFWDGYFGRTSEFSHLPLWAAHYDLIANLSIPPFGGWAAPVIKQFKGTTEFCGVGSVDLNYADPTLFSTGGGGMTDLEEIEILTVGLRRAHDMLRRIQSQAAINVSDVAVELSKWQAK